jgi:predicted nucleic acid-binding protein
MSGFRVMLDTCVLVPIVKADLLLTLARRGAFHPLWSDAILGELFRAIVKANPNITEARAAARIRDMNHAFEDAIVEGWEPIEECIAGLPDPDDRHVVAAAVRGNAAAIITDNNKHFPNDALESWGLHAVTSDEFLCDALDLNLSGMLGCLIEMVERRKHPPVTVEQILASLAYASAGTFAHEVLSILNDDWCFHDGDIDDPRPPRRTIP